MDRIIIQEAEIPPFGPPSWSDSYAVVEVASRDGWSHVERIDVPKGFHRNPLSRAEVKQKFVACAGHHPSAHVDGPAAFELIGGIAGDEQAGTLMRRVLQT
jgi:2-methylcitrate dehydratase PrpD